MYFNEGCMRKAEIVRKTKETDISLKLDLDLQDESKIESNVPFFDHMLNAFSKHGRFYLSLKCCGDLQIDSHHSVEDIGICLGQALKTALANKKGIERFGFGSLPMDESLAQVSLDLSGRAAFKYTGVNLDGVIHGSECSYAEELTIEFLTAFANNAELNLHVNVPYGTNRHHIHEAIFKALAVAFRTAVSITSSQIPSTKGVI